MDNKRFAYVLSFIKDREAASSSFYEARKNEIKITLLVFHKHKKLGIGILSLNTRGCTQPDFAKSMLLLLS